MTKAEFRVKIGVTCLLEETMNKALSFLKTVLDKLIYVIRALAGAAAILAIIFGAFAFSDNEYKTGALQILVGALLFLFFSAQTDMHCIIS